jgi:hypothetical protein
MRPGKAGRNPRTQTGKTAPVGRAAILQLSLEKMKAAQEEKLMPLHYILNSPNDKLYDSYIKYL